MTKTKRVKNVGIDKANAISIQLAAKKNCLDDWGRHYLTAIETEKPSQKQISLLRSGLGILGVTMIEDVNPKDVLRLL